ncbi:epidermal growth factor receptor kinase substrate 8-like protein 3 [Vombatus ursinus]|uniref:epidermal growth factor receptor kinase substrate 8-like protein 3 n=1 Tax=Vombatus ursinus TaxID=29139 RepID=UPI000FFDA06B|nr:epidermal growth factor receptor kinase substrate 8-like protein 3 [Vombatus ursinus]
MDSELCRHQSFNMNKNTEHQMIKTTYPRENQYPTRDMEILIHVKDDIITFVEKVKEKVNKEKESKVWLPAPQYIDYFQKIKYAFNLLGKISSCLEESIVRELVFNLFQSLEFVIYYCPNYKTLPRLVNCPLLTDKAIKLLNTNLKENHINYWKKLGTAWTVTRDSWPEYEPVPPAYTPTFYDGWQLPEITHFEPVKTDAKDQVEQRIGGPQSSRSLFPRLYIHSSPLESTRCVVDFTREKKGEKVTKPLEFQSQKRPQGLCNPAYA